jgi:hypothetical protein
MTSPPPPPPPAPKPPPPLPPKNPPPSPFPSSDLSPDTYAKIAPRFIEKYYACRQFIKKADGTDKLYFNKVDALQACASTYKQTCVGVSYYNNGNVGLNCREECSDCSYKLCSASAIGEANRDCLAWFVSPQDDNLSYLLTRGSLIGAAVTFFLFAFSSLRRVNKKRNLNKNGEIR